MTVETLVLKLQQLPQYTEVLIYDADAQKEMPVTGYLFDDKECILQSDEL